jgi:hypothetical protein
MRFLAFTAFLLFLTNTSFGFDHAYADYAVVLKTVVRSDGAVRYADLKKNRNGLDQVIEELRAVTAAEYKKWTREQQIAFWINTYNAWTLRIVIDHYPISRNGLPGLMFPENSVRQIDGVWDNYKLQGPAGRISLNEMEHRILRGEFKEPRIHFAIVCASVGCPALRSEPYVAARLDAQLEDAATKFVWNASKVRLDKSARRIDLSQIFQWFAEDFRPFADDQWKHEYAVEKAGPLAFIGRYLPPEDALFLKTGPVDISYFSYDWSLNEAE